MYERAINGETLENRESLVSERFNVPYVKKNVLRSSKILNKIASVEVTRIQNGRIYGINDQMTRNSRALNMYEKCLFTILVVVAIECTCSMNPDKEHLEMVEPSAIDQPPPNDKRFIAFEGRSLNPDGKSHNGQTSNNENAKDSREEKNTRRILSTSGTSENGDDPDCCGSRYEIGSSSRQVSGGEIDSEGRERFTSRYGNRPDDGYGWHSYNPESAGRRGSIGSSTSSASADLHASIPGERYGTRRPPPYTAGENNVERPAIGNRPPRPAYGYGGNNYGDSGAYGSSGYEVGRPGGGAGYGQRHPGGINFNAGRPPGGIYGIGHGIYGTIGQQQDEFPGQEDGTDGGPDGGPPPPGINNLQTQKAVALKALAGVALIGAAAALATNPVLLPIGVLAGRRRKRRRRSLNSPSELENIDKLTKLLENLPEFYRDKVSKEMVAASPSCVARLACEIQREYKTERNTGEEQDLLDVHQRFNRHLVNSIQLRVLDAGILYKKKSMKKLMKSVEPYRGNCNIFACDLTR